VRGCSGQWAGGPGARPAQAPTAAKHALSLRCWWVWGAARPVVGCSRVSGWAMDRGVFVFWGGGLRCFPTKKNAPCFGFAESSWSCSRGATGATATTTAARQLLRGRSLFRGEWGAHPVFFWWAHCAASPLVTFPSNYSASWLPEVRGRACAQAASASYASYRIDTIHIKTWRRHPS
jgi:hypothetical protein